jgi:hypothetical protein
LEPMETPERIHFFSWETRVSIELPVGFEEQFEDPDTNSAVYADDLDEADEDDQPGARVMTRMSALPEGTEEAHLSMAEASARVGARSVEKREELAVDGFPAIRQTLTYRDDDLEIDVFRHETFIQVANVLFSITCLAPAVKREDYQAAFDYASETARCILLPEHSGTFTHEMLRISAVVPDTWSVSEIAENHVRFFSPPQEQYDNHRSTFSISRGEPEGFGEQWFQDFCEASLAALARGLSEFELRSVERFTLSSFVDIHAVWYSYTSESGLPFVQLQVLGLMDRYNLYLINAATLQPLAETTAPVFDAILRSLRMLPTR